MSTEQLSISENAESTDSKNYGEELVKREEIENTPFQIITAKDDEKIGAFIAWGKYRLTEVDGVEATKERAKKLSASKLDWEVIGVMMTIIKDFNS